MLGSGFMDALVAGQEPASRSRRNSLDPYALKDDRILYVDMDDGKESEDLMLRAHELVQNQYRVKREAEITTFVDFIFDPPSFRVRGLRCGRGAHPGRRLVATCIAGHGDRGL